MKILAEGGTWAAGVGSRRRHSAAGRRNWWP